MGNGLNKEHPDPMKLNKCSDGIWEEVYDPTKPDPKAAGIKERLQRDRALIVPPRFCDNAFVNAFLPDPSPRGIDLYEGIWEFSSLQKSVNNVPRAGTVCTGIGDPVEWYPFDQAGVCQYNDCEPGYECSGCNGVCCAIAGNKVSCARVAFKADPVVCCFNDMECDGDEDKCFQTPEKQRTCHPNFRNLSSQICRDTIKDYCTGDKLFPSQSDWLEMWLEDSEIEVNSGMKEDSTVYNPFPVFNRPEVKVRERGIKYPKPEKQPCLRAIARNLTKQRICSFDDLQEGSVITGNYDPEGLQWGREILRKVVDRFEGESGTGLLESINTEGVNKYSSFYNTLWGICNKVPLLCTNGNSENPEGILPSLCQNMTSETLANTPNAIKWCACHMPDSEYEDYQNKFNISKECTPICNREGVIPSINSSGERAWCIQNTCILDTNNINITESQFSDQSRVTFRQLCPGCGKGNVRREYNYGDYKQENDAFYSIPEPYPRVESSYINIYGFGYSELNFNDPDMIIECIYTTQKFLDNKEIDYEKDFITNLPVPEEGETQYLTMTVQFGQVSYGLDQIFTGVVNAVMDSNNTPNNEKDPFIVLFSKETITIDGIRYYKRLKMAGNTPETASYAGYIGNKKPDNFVMKRPLTLKLNKKFQEQNKEFFSKTKWSSYEGKVDASVCSCTMDNFTLTALNSRFEGSINFTQECGRSKCFDENGKVISCADTPGEEPEELKTLEYIETVTAEQEAAEEYSYAFIILISIIGFLFLLYFVYILIHKTM